jgi:hypothetical protein
VAIIVSLTPGNEVESLYGYIKGVKLVDSVSIVEKSQVYLPADATLHTCTYDFHVFPCRSSIRDEYRTR